ncbi:hypothetical protein RDABS01_005283 [Bienertia sinuspersici]
MVSENSNLLKRPRPLDWQRPLPLRKHVKRNNNVPPVKRNNDVPHVEVVDDGHRRRWEDMDHDILVSIMKRLDLRVLLIVICLVCKSWLNATLDALFPPNHVFSFRNYPLLNSCHPFLHQRSRLWTMIKLHLNRNLHCYTKLILSHGKLKISGFHYIAERTPSITSLFVHMNSQKLLRFREFASCWKGLVELECYSVSCALVMGLVLGNQIQKLSLEYAEVNVQKAIDIVNYFPSLTHLSLEHCTLSNDALSVLLQPQKNLTYLDMRHACVNEKRDPKDWDEQLLSKANNIPQFLRCESGYCSFCFPCNRLPPC